VATVVHVLHEVWFEGHLEERGRGSSMVLEATTRPGGALITWTVSERKTASRSSCVTNTTVHLLSSHRACITPHSSSGERV